MLFLQQRRRAVHLPFQTLNRRFPAKLVKAGWINHWSL